MIRIVPLRHSDVFAVTNLELQCFAEPWSKEQVAADLRNPAVVGFGLVQSPPEGPAPHALVGYALFRIVLETAELCRIGVAPGSRGRGLAGVLLRTAMERLEEAQVEEVFLEVRDNNFAAIALYEASNFKCIATRRRYYSDGSDALVLRRRVSL